MSLGSRFRNRTRSSLVARLRARTRVWARKRHGRDTDPFTIPTRRVYILPTRMGLFFAGMLFLMFLGSMNYANNLALGLTFVLASVGLVAMHHCQRNLAGLRIGAASTDAVFAGQTARFAVALYNDAHTPRYEIALAADDGGAPPASLTREERVVVKVDVHARQRGRLQLDHLQVSTNYPFGLFRAWTHVHVPMSCVIYPKPAERGLAPPPTQTDTGGAQDTRRGDEDFAGLRSFHAGDSPRRIAWKAYARGQELQVKEYAGTAVTSHILDWENLAGLNAEGRLAQLCRWVEDAHAAGRAFGLRLPGIELPVNFGNAHRHRCLTELALFSLDPAAQ